MEKATAIAAPCECPECGQECQDQRGLRGHLRFGHDMSTEQIREAVGQTADRQQEQQQAEPVEVEEAETLPVLHESSNSGAPAHTQELPHNLRELQQLLQRVRRYKREAEKMKEEEGLFEEDEAARKLVRVWEEREERVTRRIVEIGAEEGVEEDDGDIHLSDLFGGWGDGEEQGTEEEKKEGEAWLDG